jgi:hypothetical protein
LSLNPGYDPDDETAHGYPAFIQASRANVAHADSSYPFYLLAPVLSDAPGARYWRARLRWLVEEMQARSGSTREGCWQKVANGILCVEYSPITRASTNP